MHRASTNCYHVAALDGVWGVGGGGVLAQVFFRQPLPLHVCVSPPSLHVCVSPPSLPRVWYIPPS